MPQYYSPGVYVEEVPSSNAPIAGASTSTAGFVGYVDDKVRMPAQPGRYKDKKDTRSNPDGTSGAQDLLVPLPFALAAAGVPVLITSWEQYKNTFGDFQWALPLPKDASVELKADYAANAANYNAHPEYNSALAHAVYGFFNNGGSRVWVVRTTAAPVAKTLADALNALGAVDEIALVAVPGLVDVDLQKQVYQHCETMGDRFAILDATASDAVAMTPDAIAPNLGTSNYAALYYPWIQVADPATGNKAIVAPSGHIAGLYARVDGEKGVHKAPANEVIRGALNLARRVSKAEQDGLNPAGINIIREFNGNIKVWGARTLGGDANTEWKYINVRRTFLYLRKSIDNGTQWAVFEPNTPALWQKIVRNVNAFLTNVWRAGALFGATAGEAFYVKCDATTNPPELREMGQVVTEIGVSVVRPAEFVIFRISQWAGPGK
ncbi:MAG: phage tail protein [Gemmatimonadetes bacterium]|nr:phage tail protein [Gemmatimonadota bacterium]